MKLKKVLYGLFFTVTGLVSCSENLNMEISLSDSKPHEGNENIVKSQGVLLLGETPDSLANGTLTFITPEGIIKQDIWSEVNGSVLPNSLRDLYVYNGKIYILCGRSDSDQADRGIVVADAKTFKKEAVYPLFDMRFEKPEGTGPEYIPRLLSPKNIVVLDEKNIFILDQGLFRFDSTTGRMVAVKGTYHIANTVQGHGNLESKVGSKMVVVDGKLYIASAGFWGDDSGVYEIVRDKDEVNRKLEISLDLASALIKGEHGELLLASYTRNQTRYNKIRRIDLNSFSVTETITPMKLSLAPGFFNRNGMGYVDDYLFLSEIKEGEMETIHKMTLNKISLATGKDEVIANFKDVVPDAEYLTTNPVLDVHNKLIYVSVTDDPSGEEGTSNHILIYDCMGNLKQQLSDKIRLVTGIYFMADFEL